MFILLVAAIIDFGMGLFSYMTVINATREGARLAVTNCVETNCSAAVQARTVANANGLNPSVSVACATADGSSTPCSTAESGGSATVTSQYTYHMIWPLTFGTEIPMTTSVKMMLE